MIEHARVREEMNLRRITNTPHAESLSSQGRVKVDATAVKRPRLHGRPLKALGLSLRAARSLPKRARSQLLPVRDGGGVAAA